MLPSWADRSWVSPPGSAWLVRVSRVTVFEQRAAEDLGGTGLGVDLELLGATTGVDPQAAGAAPALPVINEGYRHTTAWLALYRWLRAVAGSTDLLVVREMARIEEVSQNDDVARLVGADVQGSASIIVGADGYRSLVRRAIAPNNPHAKYAGFILWRALVDEALLPRELLTQESLGGGLGSDAKTARLVIYRVPGPAGEIIPGRRSITFAWYDATRTCWLRQHGFLTGGEILGSVPNSAIDEELRSELLSLALTRWRGAAREILAVAIKSELLFGTPLVEYMPERVSRGRLAIVGDAAHVASPMVGAGLSYGLMDGAALIAAVSDAGGTAGRAGSEVLRRYERERLNSNRALVHESLAQTRALLARVGDPTPAAPALVH